MISNTMLHDSHPSRYTIHIRQYTTTQSVGATFTPKWLISMCLNDQTLDFHPTNRMLYVKYAWNSYSRSQTNTVFLVSSKLLVPLPRSEVFLRNVL
jgi:hypothetical protein